MPTLSHEQFKTGQILKLMALKAMGLISARAFPPASGISGPPTRDINDQTVKPLNPHYAQWKAEYLLGGKTKRGAWRKASGPRGFGLTAQRIALDAGLGKAPANQQLTRTTAKALGILSATPSLVRLGFANETARLRAEKLQKRNRFWPMTHREEKQVLDIAHEAGHKFAKSVKVKGGTVRLELR